MNRFEVASQERFICGMWLNEASASQAEMVGLAGYDFVCLDCEHPLAGLPPTAEQIQAVRYAAHSVPGFALLIRVPNSDPATVAQYAQIGADGLVIPRVDTVEQAVAAYEATRFPPEGTRGISGQQASNKLGFGAWGFPTVIPQLESVAAEANIHELAALEQISMWFIGPADFAVSCKAKQADISQQIIDQRIYHMKTMMQDKGRQVGIMERNPAKAHALLSSGEYNMVALGTISAMIKDSLLAAKPLFSKS